MFWFENLPHQLTIFGSFVSGYLICDSDWFLTDFVFGLFVFGKVLSDSVLFETMSECGAWFWIICPDQTDRMFGIESYFEGLGAFCEMHAIVFVWLLFVCHFIWFCIFFFCFGGGRILDFLWLFGFWFSFVQKQKSV